MSNSKHTPAPWIVDEHTDNGTLIVQSRVEYDPMAIIVCNNGREYTIERQKADARLIAAAPELLEALNGIIDEVTAADGGIPNTNALINLVHKALMARTKATGE